MAGAVLHYKQGPASYTAGGLILGGQLVVPAVAGAVAGGAVIVCPAGYSTGNTNGYPVGVAAADANTGQYPEGTPSLPAGWPGDGSLTSQDELLDISILGYTVAVYNNVDINVNYDGAAVFGQFLTWSASVAGALTAYATATDPRLIVGKCTQPAGMSGAGVGRAFIRV